MCPQGGEIGYGKLVGLLSSIVVRPINSSLTSRPGSDDVAHDIGDVVIATGVNMHPRMKLARIILATIIILG